MVRTAFQAYLREGSLAKAAIWLNDQGYQLKKHIEGGGKYKRCGHFTTDNLAGMLRLKAYIGIKTYTQKGELKEAKAVWPPLIDIHTFRRVGKQLDLQKVGYKPYKEGRFPYLLSGMVFCKSCRSNMPGKSATGSSGKVGYHEHGWNTKRDATLSKAKKMFHCDPHRIPSKKLDPLVWEKVSAFATDPIFMKQLLLKVRQQHEENPHQKDRERLKAKISGIRTQVDALSERLAELPKTVSAQPIYKQMEKLQALSLDYENQLQHLKNGGKTSFEKIVGLDTLESFGHHYKSFVNNTATFVHRKELVKKFVNKVEVSPDSVFIHFIVDEDYYKEELALKRVGSGPYGRPIYENVQNFSSSSLTVGAQAAQVDEPRTVFIFELEAYPEAKALSPAELRALYEATGSFYEVADIIGASEGFARQNAKKRRR
jgi:hypothetical protein